MNQGAYQENMLRAAEAAAGRRVVNDSKFDRHHDEAMRMQALAIACASEPEFAVNLGTKNWAVSQCQREKARAVYREATGREW